MGLVLKKRWCRLVCWHASRYACRYACSWMAGSRQTALSPHCDICDNHAGTRPAEVRPRNKEGGRKSCDFQGRCVSCYSCWRRRPDFTIVVSPQKHHCDVIGVPVTSAYLIMYAGVHADRALETWGTWRERTQRIRTRLFFHRRVQCGDMRGNEESSSPWKPLFHLPRWRSY